jgi:ammonia channel protein AmtB
MVFITARFIEVTIGPHVREEEGATGLDIARHSEKAYA